MPATLSYGDNGDIFSFKVCSSQMTTAMTSCHKINQHNILLSYMSFCPMQTVLFSRHTQIHVYPSMTDFVSHEMIPITTFSVFPQLWVASFFNFKDRLCFVLNTIQS